MTFSKDKRQETIIYLVLWSLLFIAPVLSLWIRTATAADTTFDWHEVIIVWQRYSVFFVIFLVHNHLMAPLLVYRQKKTIYLSALAVVVALFTVYQCSTRPSDIGRHLGPPPHKMERSDFADRPDFAEKPDFADRPDFADNPDFQKKPEPPEFSDNKKPPRKPDHKPPIMVGQHDIVSIVILILLLGANLGIKLYFRNTRDRKRLDRLEKENLQQQLEYLKYQLNPHFLMNTLNNIHALIDIDTDEAKEAVLQLSKMLRYVLYDSNKEQVPLAKEIEFLQNYAMLMRMRYTDSLHFSFTEPARTGGVNVAPLLFVTFVENAFKHGVSYQQPSFIDITMAVGRRLVFTCRNSKHPSLSAVHQSPATNQGGVGLINIRRRLDLIYGGNYTLTVNETDNTYNVHLEIPLSAPTSAHD